MERKCSKHCKKFVLIDERERYGLGPEKGLRLDSDRCKRSKREKLADVAVYCLRNITSGFRLCKSTFLHTLSTQSFNQQLD